MIDKLGCVFLFSFIMYVIIEGNRRNNSHKNFELLDFKVVDKYETYEYFNSTGRNISKFYVVIETESKVETIEIDEKNFKDVEILEFVTLKVFTSGFKCVYKKANP